MVYLIKERSPENKVRKGLLEVIGLDERTHVEHPLGMQRSTYVLLRLRYHVSPRLFVMMVQKLEERGEVLLGT